MKNQALVWEKVFTISILQELVAIIYKERAQIHTLEKNMPKNTQ